LEARAGETVSPAARLEQSTPALAWAGFQGGPARTGLAGASARGGLTLRWKSRAEDGVRSSPVIRGDTAFLASDTSFVRAVNLSSGELLWSNGIVGSKVNPVPVGEFVFAGNDVGRFEGLRAAKGKVKGTISLGSGLAGLAAVSDDLLLAATSSGMLLAIKTRKNMVGRLPLKYQWEITIPDFAGSTATPLILGDRAILQTAEGKLLALAVADGSVIWPGGTKITRGAEAIADPEADISFRFAGSRGFLTPTPAVDRDVIYAAHGDRLRAVSADDGSLLWERGIDGTISSSVSLAWGTIYLGCSDGSVRAFSCRQGVPLFRARCGVNPIFASPVLFDGQLLAATGEGKIFLLNAFSGKVLAEDNTLAGTPIDATPAVWPGGILVINRDGVMACFE
jgi:outer membrane protein assembly factor BamB